MCVIFVTFDRFFFLFVVVAKNHVTENPRLGAGDCRYHANLASSLPGESPFSAPPFFFSSGWLASYVGQSEVPALITSLSLLEVSFYSKASQT